MLALRLARRLTTRRLHAFAVSGATPPHQIASLLDEHGVVVIDDFLTTELDRVATTLLEKTNEAMALTEGVPLGVGSRDSFEEVVLRSPHRYDVPAPFAAFSEGDLAKCRAVAEATLGADCKEAFCGIVLSKPGAPAQGWHADSRHDSAEHQSAKILNVLIALDDACADYESGPTEFVPRSHVSTNHHTGSFDEDIVYQRDHQPETVGFTLADVVAAKVPRGGAVIFDDRILHRGGANHSLNDRAVGYFSYRRADVEADTHFEAFRSLNKLRQQVGTFDVGAEFPGLPADASLLDGAAGSQCHHTVVEAVSRQIAFGANVGGQHPHSLASTDVLREARGALGDLLHCESDEVVFGPSATALVVHVARALGGTWSEGDNVVLSIADHDSNVQPWVLAAQRAGCDIRYMTVREDGSLDVDALETLVDENTRLIACGLASNGTGTIHDCHRIATLKKNALTFFDGVHYAPHNLIDVQALDADFLVVSPYKFFGPHCGALYGRRELLSSLKPDKLRVSDDGLPRDESCYLSRWELGTPSFEALSGATAAVDYLAALGDRFGGITDGGSLTRRDRLRAGFAAIGAHEHLLKRQFLAGVDDIAGLCVYGVSDALDARAATFAVAKEGVAPAALVEHLRSRKVYATHGTHYCPALWEALGSSTDVTRISFLHYNSCRDVEHALEGLRSA
ncbi:unnamed protein product [Pelagomonas calceolata]|uniref:Aminotransferase class V domain-containing protein n=1 Tax=Pelagomonas calceolata TaxID=35677 RepID=A0A8J2SYW4_9STRA|nr:unnamed protein product [Pelagomonas calceolata]